eukprot:scaffold713_cov131-Cylindrotheca_fusiformis.AAC.8
MEETEQYKSHVTETEGEVAEGEVAATSPSIDNVDNASDEKDTQRCKIPRKARFGLIALLAIAVIAVAAGVLLSKGSDNEVSISTSDPTSDPTSDSLDMELLAKFVLPGVRISDLNETAPQFRALEWLAYEDPRNFSVEEDATEILELYSLATLYYALGGEDYGFCWLYVPGPELLNSSYHCDWCSIKCDETGLVDNIDFYSDGMRGTLPPEIGNFRNARAMKFHISGLKGSVPAEIGNLRQLTSLDLSYNQLSGSIPSEIENIYGNSNTFTFVTIAFRQLTYLDLSYNSFSGTVPNEIGNLQQLIYLDLYGNTFFGTIPSEIGKLQQLVYLDLYGNTFFGTIPSEIGKLQQLSRLALGANAFSGTVPSEIGELQQLAQLSLSDNIGLTGTVPMEVGQLESIIWATFQNTSLTGGLDDLAFCQKEYQFFRLASDCGGAIPEITCECCTICFVSNGDG